MDRHGEAPLLQVHIDLERVAGEIVRRISRVVVILHDIEGYTHREIATTDGQERQFFQVTAGAGTPASAAGNRDRNSRVVAWYRGQYMSNDVAELLQSMPELEPSADSWQRIAAQQAREASLHRVRLGGGFAAAAAVVIAIIFATQRLQQPELAVAPAISRSWFRPRWRHQRRSWLMHGYASGNNVLSTCSKCSADCPDADRSAC